MAAIVASDPTDSLTPPVSIAPEITHGLLHPPEKLDARKRLDARERYRLVRAQRRAIDGPNG
jgi:hypothetical protein